MNPMNAERDKGGTKINFLFSHVRRRKWRDKRKILISDTVGFPEELRQDETSSIITDEGNRV